MATLKSLAAPAKRWTYLVHRWTGIVGCVLMFAWFVSGITMLFVGYPKLTTYERLANAPTLTDMPIVSGMPDARTPETRTPGTRMPDPATVLPAGVLDQEVVLATVGRVPRFIVEEGGKPAAYALDGRRVQSVSEQDALSEAERFVDGAPVVYRGLMTEDRWTHSRGLDVHRPLHRVDWAGDTSGTVYVSSVTGQVVLDAPVAQQRWNYIGAWLHWLYMFRAQSVDPVWSWTVIVLSAVATVTALTGMVVGVWRWRFQGRYKSGRRTPYREGWMRWHHIIGLFSGVLVCTWIFSGLMSMNPFGIFSSADPKPDLQAYRAALTAERETPSGQDSTALDDPTGLDDSTALDDPTGLEDSTDLGDPSAVAAADVLRVLRQTGFQAVELHWRWLAGKRFVLAYDSQARTRIYLPRHGATEATVVDLLPVGDVQSAARQLFPGAAMRGTVLSDYDTYYYQRQPEAMNGGTVYGLPALRLEVDSAVPWLVYIDLRTGDVVRSLGRPERASRWLFYFLHSWDVPAFLNWPSWRDVLMIVFSLAGALVSLTGVVIGVRRLRPHPPQKR